MRKQEKEIIQKSIGLLENTLTFFCNGMKNEPKENMVDLLTDMQQIAIRIGTAIERSEGTGYPVIAEFEKLCELYYQCSLCLEQMDEEGITLICQAIKNITLDVTKEIEAIKVKKEILFLPYQVSMWDSLESVWMAADKDECTDCYVMPLPVYDINPDGSIGELQYEGDRYPDYVPITPYWEYNLEERHPDIIYFHNPYDDMNYVTRVPEKYYSRNLKKYTDMLVYISYFLSEDGGPADHQCYTPGVLFADRVVVQPGKVYQKYCRVYTAFLKENGLEQILVPAQEKFLPLGSPKIDKVLNTKCTLEDLPESWQKLIRKPDGARKKIVLYNLSIEPLLQNSDKILRKVRDVLEVFQGVQEEIVLLWRPHPLLMKTINAMRPQIRDEYLAIVQEFKSGGWGIFDETPDPNLAMVLSDAYYGDFSSLVTTYRALKKPVLLQDIDSIYND